MKFANNKAGIKLIQSFKSDIVTVTNLTYVATAASINKAKGVAPTGRPKTTSEIIPERNIKPYPKICGLLKTQK